MVVESRVIMIEQILNSTRIQYDKDKSSNEMTSESNISLSCAESILNKISSGLQTN